MVRSAADLLVDVAERAIRQEARVGLAEWARANIILERGPSPGPYRIEFTPYLKEIGECLSAHSPVRLIAFMKGAQIGASELGNAWIGYTIDHDPCDMMAVQPTIPLAERFNTTRIAPMIRSCRSVERKVREGKALGGASTSTVKDFPGGALVVTGANSAVSLRQMPFRKGFFDELDGWPIEIPREGDPLQLARRGMRMFRNSRKEFDASTPEEARNSRILQGFLAGDRRFFHVPCPRCGEFQPLYWKPDGWTRKTALPDSPLPENGGIVFDPLPDPSAAAATVRYVCEHCEAELEEWEKSRMLPDGIFVPAAPENNPDGTTPSYHVSALYSPVEGYSWAEAVQSFLESKHDPAKLKVWVNHTLGEAWFEKAEVPEWESLYQRREPYATNKMPRRALVLTAGADVQKDRIEVEIVGWGRGLESWSIDHRVFPGGVETSAPWLRLEALLQELFDHESGGRSRIKMLAVDAGNWQSIVLAWARKQPRHSVMAVKGSNNPNHPVLVGSPSAADVTISGRKLRRGAQLWIVGTGIAKRELYSWLRLPKPIEQADPYPPGFVHFPEYAAEYFRQLTAEQLVPTINKRGYREYAWELMQGRRNEVLDCRVYARVAAEVVGVSRLGEQQWREIERSLRPEAAEVAKVKRAKKPRQDYLGRWRGSLRSS